MKDEEKTQLIQNAQSMVELERAVLEITKDGPVCGSHKMYDGKTLCYKLEQLKMFAKTLDFMNMPWQLMTRTHGLRAKCMELYFYQKRGI